MCIYTLPLFFYVLFFVGHGPSHVLTELDEFAANVHSDLRVIDPRTDRCGQIWPAFTFEEHTVDRFLGDKINLFLTPNKLFGMSFI